MMLLRILGLVPPGLTRDVAVGPPPEELDKIKGELVAAAERVSGVDHRRPFVWAHIDPVVRSHDSLPSEERLRSGHEFPQCVHGFW